MPRATWRPLIGYSTNVHRGEDLKAIRRYIREYTVPVRDRVYGRGAPAGLELRLGARSAADLRDREARESFRAFLEDARLELFSINAFPLLDFHARRVKEKVYRPSWAEPERARITNDIATILADILPPGVTGSVSTLGGAFRRAPAPIRSRERIARGYLDTVRHLARLEEETGRTIVLAAEPEPETTLETARDVIDFFEGELLPVALGRSRGAARARAEEELRRFFTVNLDTCHSSVLFEEPARSLRDLRKAGIEVGKLHVTSALSVQNPGRSAAYEDLRSMDEPRYFHQFAGRDAAGAVTWRGLDLDELPPQEEVRRRGIVEIRSHYHVPLYRRKWKRLDTTREETRRAVLEAAGARRCSHLVVETYTWPLLASEDRLVEGIAREIEWLIDTLAEARVDVRPGSRARSGALATGNRPL